MTRQEAYHRKLRDAIAHQSPEKTGGVASIHDLVLMKGTGSTPSLRLVSLPLIDHFLRPDATLQAFYQAHYGEQGDFVDQPYQCRIVKKGGNVQVQLHRDGHVWVHSDWAAVRVSKTVRLQAKENSLQTEYDITNQHHDEISLWFGTESIFALMAGDAPDRYYASPQCEIVDAKLASLSAKPPALICAMNGWPENSRADRTARGFWRCHR